jgi:23S rRNA (adenine-N6)-dimethyltransferase
VPASVPGRTARSWGWHRLADSWARRVVAAAEVRPGDLVLDVGAGEGALTGPLLAAGAQVIAIELHAGRRAALRRRFGADVTVVDADATSLRLPRRPFRVVSSPPYSVSTALLRRLLAPGSHLRSADLVLQRAVVGRFVDGRSSGSGRWSRDFVLQRGLAVPRTAFTPAPRVDSAVLVVRRAGAAGAVRRSCNSRRPGDAKRCAI